MNHSCCVVFDYVKTYKLYKQVVLNEKTMTETGQTTQFLA